MAQIDNGGNPELQECLNLSSEIKKRFNEKTETGQLVINRVNEFLERLDEGEHGALEQLNLIHGDIQDMASADYLDPDEYPHLTQYIGWHSGDMKDFYYIMYGEDPIEKSDSKKEDVPPKETVEIVDYHKKFVESVLRLRELKERVVSTRRNALEVDINYGEYADLFSAQNSLLMGIKKALTQEKTRRFLIFKVDQRLTTISTFISDFRKKQTNEDTLKKITQTLVVHEKDLEEVTIDESLSEEQLKEKCKEIQKEIEVTRGEGNDWVLRHNSQTYDWLREFKKVIPIKEALIKEIEQALSDNSLEKQEKIDKLNLIMQNKILENIDRY